MQESKSRSRPTAWVVRYRVWVVAGWALTVLALAPRAARVDRFLAVAPPIGGEAVVVDAELAARFVSPFVNYVILIVGGGPQPVEPRGRALLDSILACVGRVPGVLRVRSYETPRDTLFFVPGHEATFVVVGLDGLRHTPEDVVLELRRATSALLPALSERFPSLTLRWTGRAALNADLRQASSADVSAAERRALPLTLLVLVAAFGTLVATLLPVASGALVITIALGLATLVGARWPLATLAQSFIAMIGLGLGIDYALLMVSRFRESLGAGLSPDAAACDAARTAGRTIMLSGAAVAVGFAALLAIPHSELKAAAVGGLLSAATAVLLSISLVPALLSWIGSGIDRGRLWPARWALRTRAAWPATRRRVAALGYRVGHGASGTGGDGAQWRGPDDPRPHAAPGGARCPDSGRMGRSSPDAPVAGRGPKNRRRALVHVLCRGTAALPPRVLHDSPVDVAAVPRRRPAFRAAPCGP